MKEKIWYKFGAKIKRKPWRKEKLPKVIRFEEMPNEIAVLKSIYRDKERAKSHYLKYYYHEWWKEAYNRYLTVQLALVIYPEKYGSPKKIGWMIAYEGEPNTGPFNSKREAIDWFIKGGR